MHASILDASHPTIATRIEKDPAQEHERIIACKAFAYQGLVDHAPAEIEWARDGLDLVDTLSPPSP